MPKGVPNKRYTPEFKQLVVETMREEGLSLSETMRRFNINCLGIIKRWERIYLEEGPEGLAVERRGRKNTGQPAKLPKEIRGRFDCGKSTAASGKCLPKKFASLGFGSGAMPAQKSLVVQKLRHDFSLSLLAVNRSTASCNLLLSFEANGKFRQISRGKKKKSRQSTTKTKVDTAIVVLRQNCTIVDFI
ncbi:transposase [Gallintestinimicrobium sp.]